MTEQVSEPTSWQPKDLKVGDRVGVLVTSSGDTCVIQNDVEMARASEKVPLDTPLFAVVNLLGNTAAVELVQNATPPLHFDKRLVSRFVKITDGDMKATHTDAAGEEVCGVVFCPAPVPIFDQGAYFEVRVEALRNGNDDGLVIGVTRQLPIASKKFEPPELGDAVPYAWAAGFDGQASKRGRSGDDQEMVPIEWKPSELKKGDHVGLFLKRDSGEAWIVLNGSLVCKLPWEVPLDRALYPFVDLLGNTLSVSIIRGARPPEGTASGSKWCQWNLTNLSFDCRRASRFIALSELNKKARYTDESGEEGQGVLYTHDAIPRFGHTAAYYEVIVTELREGNPDGLTLGITTVRPDKAAEPAMFADEVASSWTFGYDGQFIWTPADPIEEDRDTSKEHIRFRSQVSTYKVCRFNRSVFGELHPKHDDVEEDEDEDEDEATDSKGAGKGGGYDGAAPPKA